jgi:hypothetical protein
MPLEWVSSDQMLMGRMTCWKILHLRDDLLGMRLRIVRKLSVGEDYLSRDSGQSQNQCHSELEILEESYHRPRHPYPLTRVVFHQVRGDAGVS